VKRAQWDITDQQSTVVSVPPVNVRFRILILGALNEYIVNLLNKTLL